jgi:enoyl-CoA hydratase/carnithine racemase
MSNDAILTKVEDQILTVTFNRPDKKNSFTTEMMFALADIFKQANLDDDVRCIVVTGNGDYFCSGYDVSGGGSSFTALGSDNILANDTETINKNSPGSQVGLSIYGCYKPVIAAINGSAAGVGATMILPMDYRLVSENAKLGYVFTRRGVVPEAGSTWFLPRVVGMTKAMDWMISGRYVHPPEALESGLVSGIYNAEDLLPAAYAIAKDIVENTSAVAVACTRQLLWRMAGEQDLAKATAVESSCFYSLANGPEAFEGVVSFLQKRLPKFPGKVTKDMPPVFSKWGKT